MKWIKELGRLFFPAQCPMCGRALNVQEKEICTACLMQLPYTHLHGESGNLLERIFWGKIPVQRVSAYLIYYHEDVSNQIVRRLKYQGRGRLGIVFGRMMATDLLGIGFFDGIDAIVPVPLHPKRLKERGYNQAERIAQGIAQISGIQIDNKAVKRSRNCQSQTSLNKNERLKNVEGAFSVEHPERYAHKHLLLVDDVMTTGATLCACAQAFQQCDGVQFSILTLAHGSSLTSIPHYLVDDDDDDDFSEMDIHLPHNQKQPIGM